MNAPEIIDCNDLIQDLDLMASLFREGQMEYWDTNSMADDLNKAADKLANLVERMRMQ